MNIMSCREVSRVVASDGIGTSRWDRVATRLHLLMCRGCRAYRRQLRLIGQAARDAFQKDGTDDAATRAAIEAALTRNQR